MERHGNNFRAIVGKPISGQDIFLHPETAFGGNGHVNIQYIIGKGIQGFVIKAVVIKIKFYSAPLLLYGCWCFNNQ